MDKFEIDIKGLILFVLRKSIFMVLAAIVCAGIGYMYADSLTPLYTASVSLYVNNYNENVQTEVKRITGSDVATAKSLVSTYLEFLKSSKVLDEVSNQLNGEYSAEAIKAMMSANAMNDTEIFQINITNPDKAVATKIVNAVAEKAPQIIQSYIKGSSVEVVDYAKEPWSKSFPSVKKYIIMGGFAGGAISFLAIVLIFLFNSKIGSKEDIEKLFTAPVIGEIPNFMQSETARGRYYTNAYYKKRQPEGRFAGGNDKRNTEKKQ